MAGLAIREKFSFTKTAQHVIYQFIMGQSGIQGCVIITTCNRTEIYLSYEDEEREEDPFDLLCRAIGEEPAAYQTLHKVRWGKELFWHLCRLACGARSQIWGEDQIITQVKQAQAMARECGAADSYLEVLFRMAITGAKRIKTAVKFPRGGNSVAHKTKILLERQMPCVESVLVIGNGEVGKMVAETLRQQYAVAMTLRQYKHGDIQVAEGVETMEYASRYKHMGEFDAVVSATLSPHYTIEKEAFAALTVRPRILVDLAVPRDIDPAISSLQGVALYDVDTMADDAVREDRQRLMKEIDGIIAKYYDDFNKWLQYKEVNVL